MSWRVQYHKEAIKDLKKLDNSQQKQVLKAIEKVSDNPLSQYEGGYGKPLSNKSNTKLAGYLKIKLLKLGIRVVYGLVKENETMKIIVISVRSDDLVYRLASNRIKDIGKR